MTCQNNISCPNCPNVSCFIKSCSPDWIQLLSDKKSESKYKKNQHVFIEGHPIFGVYFIQQGKVKVICSNHNGKEQIVRLATSGHILGHRGYGKESYPVGAVTLEDSRICFLDNGTLYDAFIANPVFTYSIMMFYSMELRKSEQRTKFFAQMTVEEKVIYALFYIIHIFGFTKKGKSINVIFSRQEIADIAGTNAEQVSRTISFLKEKNIISLKGKEIVLEDYNSMKNIVARYSMGSS